MTSDLRPFIKQLLVWVCCFMTDPPKSAKFICNLFLTGFYGHRFTSKICVLVFLVKKLINCLPTSTLLKLWVRKQQQPVF